jgi:hypothetical protein
MGRRAGIPLAACALFWGVAAAADEASRYEIEFDLTDSVVVAGGLLEIPPDGAIGSGSLLLSVPATAAGYVFPGAAEISDLEFALTANASRFSTTVSGPFAAAQQGSAAGTLSNALDEVVLSSPVFLDRNGTISCTGTFCWLFADAFPLVTAGIESIPAPATLKVANLGQWGGATLSDTIAVTMNSGTAVFRITGAERRRTYLPEPRAVEVIVAGGLVLALLARRRLPAERAALRSRRRR